MSDFSFKKPLNLVSFYFRILACFPIQSSLIIFTGFTYRLLSIVIFVSFIKTFLIILDPTSGLKIVNEAFNSLGLELSINLDQLIKGLVIFIFSVVLTHYLVGKINLFYLLKVRKKLQLLGSKLNSHESLETKRKISLDLLPIGYESLIKINEICLFFICVLSVLFYLKPFLGFIILLIIPFFITYLTLKGRQDIFLFDAFKESKIKIGSLSQEQYESSVYHSSKHFRYMKNKSLFSDLLGGLAVTIVLAIFLLSDNTDAFSRLGSIILVFCIRFAITYTKECGVVIGRLLQQRTILINTEKIDLSCLKSELDHIGMAK